MPKAVIQGGDGRHKILLTICQDANHNLTIFKGNTQAMASISFVFLMAVKSKYNH